MKYLSIDAPVLSSSKAGEVVELCVTAMSVLAIFQENENGKEVLREIGDWFDVQMKENLVNAVNQAMYSKEPAAAIQQLTHSFGLSYTTQNYLINQLMTTLPKFAHSASSTSHSITVKHVTENERRAIFYVGGSLLSAVLKMKVGEAEMVEFVHTLHVGEEKCSSVCADWTALQSNKSLIFISDDFLKFLLECESAIVNKVATENGLRKNCLVRDMFVEACLEAKTVTDTWALLCRSVVDSVSDPLFNIIVMKFCNTRSKGFVRYLNQNSQTEARSSKSLRRSLKDN